MGWKIKPKTFLVIPYHSPILEFCAVGDINGVRSLFSRKLASPYDMNPGGLTPLHYAAGGFQPDICELLLQSGADTQAVSFLDQEYVSTRSEVWMTVAT
jgi:ankyrin repeat protein